MDPWLADYDVVLQASAERLLLPLQAREPCSPQPLEGVLPSAHREPPRGQLPARGGRVSGAACVAPLAPCSLAQHDAAGVPSPQDPGPTNGVVASAPGHPLWLSVLALMKERWLENPERGVVELTGGWMHGCVKMRVRMLRNPQPAVLMLAPPPTASKPSPPNAPCRHSRRCHLRALQPAAAPTCGPDPGSL